MYETHNMLNAEKSNYATQKVEVKIYNEKDGLDIDNNTYYARHLLLKVQTTY
jgi:hypothetical protein